MKFFSNKNKIFFFSFLIVLAFGFLGKPSDAFACSATNAVFRSNAGNDGDNFYHDLNRPYVYIDIQTQGCQGDSIQVSIVQSMGWGVDRDVGAADNKVVEINSETTNDFTLQFIAGEDWCGVYQPNLPNLFSLGYPPFMGGWDCKYYIQIIDDSGTQEFATTPVGNSSNMNLSGGSNLVYEITGITNVAWSEGNPLILAFGSSNENDQFNNANNVIPPIPPEDYYLAPLPGYEETCTDASCRLGNFLRSMFTIGIMVAGILAFIMIVVGAITYTTGDSISAKGAGKDMILNAVLGLLLALGCWIILNTINPNLASNLGINIPVVSLDQKAFVDYETPISTQSGFILAGTFENPNTSPGLTDFLNNITDTNKITTVTVNTSIPNMTITSTAGASVTIPVTGLGENGVAEVGQGQQDDRKTPKGNWLITNDIRLAPNATQAVKSKNNYNMGPAFIGNNITAPNSAQNRGIGIHGNYSNNPGFTAGCVRIKNDDVLALARKIKSGVQLIIQ